MFRKIKTTILGLSASVLTILAYANVEASSMAIFYEPDIPEELRR